MTDETIKRAWGVMPGGGSLVVYQIEPDAFGVLASPHLEALASPTKRDRRKATRSLEKLARHYNVIRASERISNIGLTNDHLGNKHLIIVAEVTTERMK